MSVHLDRMRAFWVGLGAICIAVAVMGSGAGAQEGEATLDVTVRYPDGSLVDDLDVCVSPYYVGSDGPQANGAQQTGAVTSHPIVVDAAVTVRVHGCRFGENPLKVSVWHNGMPFGAPSSTTDKLIGYEAIRTKAGSNPIEVVVGESKISGAVTGEFASSCNVVLWGDLASSDYEGPVAWAPVNDGQWEALVPPGDYRAEVSCFLRSAYEVWPNKANAGEATLISVGHGQERSGIDFDIDDRFDESEGTSFFIQFASADDYQLPKCIEVYSLDGLLVSQRFGFASGLAATNGEYRLKVADCFNLGFDDVWYPNAVRPEDAETLTVDGVLVETNLDGVTLDAPGFRTCNGQEVTIRGTDRAEELFGTDEPDVISGLGGNDVIRALDGDDIVCAGEGADRIFGNAGADWIDAGPGNDWVGGGWGKDKIYGGEGNDFIRGFKHDDWVDGGPGADRIKGGWGNDILRGGDGNDIIRGYFGADKLFGNAGNDILRAGNGPDLLIGGPGRADRLLGEQGRDTCRDVGQDAVFVSCEFD